MDKYLKLKVLLKSQKINIMIANNEKSEGIYNEIQ